LRRFTTVGAGTSVTPAKDDAADPAAQLTAAENQPAEPTYTSAAGLWEMGVDQRTISRHVLSPGRELVVPATSANCRGMTAYRIEALTFHELSHLLRDDEKEKPARQGHGFEGLRLDRRAAQQMPHFEDDERWRSPHRSLRIDPSTGGWFPPSRPPSAHPGCASIRSRWGACGFGCCRPSCGVTTRRPTWRRCRPRRARCGTGPPRVPARRWTGTPARSAAATR
jgi:hypothetical protein